MSKIDWKAFGKRTFIWVVQMTISGGIGQIDRYKVAK